MKKLAFIFVLLAIAIFVVVWWPKQPQPAKTNQARMSQEPAHDSHARPEISEFAAKGRVPAHYETSPAASELPQTLSPELFTGNIRMAYQAAKEIPQTLAQLPCYCHCDRSFGHKSLLTCFASDHGENCGICIGEALMAYNLQKRGGLNASQIREKIIAAYGDPKSQ